MPLLPGIQIGALPVMGGLAMLVTVPENLIIIQTAPDVSEPLILILAWIHPKGSQFIWLTKSESVRKPISVYRT
jgi:hypothetical protein